MEPIHLAIVEVLSARRKWSNFFGIPLVAGGWSTFGEQDYKMNSIIYIVGLVVVVMSVLGMLGLR